MNSAFTSIRQAMAVLRAREAGAAFIRDFVERKKAEGFVRAILNDNSQTDVTVASLA